MKHLKQNNDLNVLIARQKVSLERLSTFKEMETSSLPPQTQ